MGSGKKKREKKDREWKGETGEGIEEDDGMRGRRKE